MKQALGFTTGLVSGQKAGLVMLSVGLGCLLLAASARASSGPRICARIPFEFIVRGQALPAGEYTIEPANWESGGSALIRRADGEASAYFVVSLGASISPNKGSAIEFRRYGDQYYLAGYSIQGSSVACQVTISHREARLAKSTARQNQGAISVAAYGR
jgi:hypothetical protein